MQPLIAHMLEHEIKFDQEAIAFVPELMGLSRSEAANSFAQDDCARACPLPAEAMRLDDPKDLSEDIRLLRDAIAHDHYVEYGAGYDPEYGDYRGFGDDGWIDEMDDLFEAAASFFRSGKWKAAICMWFIQSG